MPEISPSKYLVRASWGDVPHIDEKTKAELRGSTLEYQRDAREHGIPSLGSGAIYQVPESEFVVEPFAIPKHWPRAYALDVGWNRTAAIWGAIDRNTSVVYFYTEHYRGKAEPSIHADAIKARGVWIPGVIDPAAHGRGQDDGKQLIKIYKELGLDIIPAKNEVEAGIYAVWQRLSTGHLKVFGTCSNFRREYRTYRRDEQGRVVKEDDHLMDCARYWILSAINRAAQPPSDSQDFLRPHAADSVAGY